MRILLSDKKPKMAYILAENDTDQKCLRILFNNSLIRGAFSFWSDKDNLPEEYKGFKSITPNITAVCVIGHNEDIEDTTKEHRISKFKEEMEKGDKIKVTEKESENFEFLNNNEEKS